MSRKSTTKAPLKPKPEAPPPPPPTDPAETVQIFLALIRDSTGAVIYAVGADGTIENPNGLTDEQVREAVLAEDRPIPRRISQLRMQTDARGPDGSKLGTLIQWGGESLYTLLDTNFIASADPEYFGWENALVWRAGGYKLLLEGRADRNSYCFRRLVEVEEVADADALANS